MPVQIDMLSDDESDSDDDGGTVLFKQREARKQNDLRDKLMQQMKSKSKLSSSKTSVMRSHRGSDYS